MCVRSCLTSVVRLSLRMMPGTALHVLALAVTTAAVADAVGPDLKARARLLRDLPMGFGGVDAIPPKDRDRDV